MEKELSCNELWSEWARPGVGLGLHRHRHWGWLCSFQLQMNSQTLAEIKLPSNGKHVIAINFILMAVSDKTTPKPKQFLKIKPNPFKQHSRNHLVVNLLYQIYANLHKTKNVSFTMAAISFSVLNDKITSSSWQQQRFSWIFPYFEGFLFNYSLQHIISIIHKICSAEQWTKCLKICFQMKNGKKIK